MIINCKFFGAYFNCDSYQSDHIRGLLQTSTDPARESRILSVNLKLVTDLYI